MTAITCEHCESEIDVASDPRCVVYDPSGATDVICEICRELAQSLMAKEWPADLTQELREAYRIKRGWRA